MERHQFRRVCARAVGIGRSPPTVVDPHIAVVGPAQLLQPVQEGREPSLFFRIVCDPVQEDADATHPMSLLRVRGARPGDCRATKKDDEFAPLIMR